MLHFNEEKMVYVLEVNCLTTKSKHTLPPKPLSLGIFSCVPRLHDSVHKWFLNLKQFVSKCYTLCITLEQSHILLYDFAHVKRRSRLASLLPLFFPLLSSHAECLSKKVPLLHSCSNPAQSATLHLKALGEKQQLNPACCAPFFTSVSHRAI